MSNQALTWAFAQHPIIPDGAGVSGIAVKFVLVALADVANEQWEAYPSVPRIMGMTDLGDQAIRRALRTLTDLGLISDTGERRGPTHRVKVWRLRGGLIHIGPNPVMVTGLGDVESGDGGLGNPVIQIGESGDPDSPSNEEPPGTPSRSEPKDQDLSSEPSSDPFEEFWRIYPRKDDKRTARAAFGRAMKRAQLEEILAGAERYAGDPHREPRFTKLPTSWLNADSWGNGAIPAPEGATDLDRWIARQTGGE